jgi:uncharacterized protein YpbB
VLPVIPTEKHHALAHALDGFRERHTLQPLCSSMQRLQLHMQALSNSLRLKASASSDIMRHAL